MKMSFYDWCVENDRMDLNDRFDELKNGCTSRDVSFRSNLKWWFRCHRGLHQSEEHKMSVVTKTDGIKIECSKCNSIAQVVIDKFGEQYLWSHWHKENIYSPWDVSYGHSRLKIKIQCTDKPYHVYEQTPQSFGRGVGCPYCNMKRVHANDSIATVFPEILNMWSSKNQKTPYEYALKSNKKVWLKCKNQVHNDYEQSLNNAYRYEYRCPECTKDLISAAKKGYMNPFWKGGINGENDTLRHRREYKEWREAVYVRDDYTCQCCGKRGTDLNAHHVYPFADYEGLRYNVDNGITLCVTCHDSTNEGSFHNLYGTHNNTPEQLREYILNKSNIDIYKTHQEILTLNNKTLTCAI